TCARTARAASARSALGACGGSANRRSGSRRAPPDSAAARRHAAPGSDRRGGRAGRAARARTGACGAGSTPGRTRGAGRGGAGRRSVGSGCVEVIDRELAGGAAVAPGEVPLVPRPALVVVAREEGDLLLRHPDLRVLREHVRGPGGAGPLDPDTDEVRPRLA